MSPFKDLFISYGRRESLNFVARLHQRLKRLGVEAWFDKVNIPDGEDYAARINHGIESAHNFVFVLAPRALTSPYCLVELEYARILGKRVIPLNQMVIFSTEPHPLSAGDLAMLAGFYGHHGLTDPGLATTQDVIDRSIALIGRTDWLDSKEKVRDEDCTEIAMWAQEYENFWHRHEDMAYLDEVEIPVYGRPVDTLDSVVERIQIVLERHRAHTERHTDILARALHWSRNQRSGQYLLVGRERETAEQWLLTEFEHGEQPPCRVTNHQAEYVCECVKNANNLMTDVFLGHAEANRDSMRTLRDFLHHRLYTVWTNQTDIQSGAAFAQAIQRGIEEADQFVFLISPQSLKSEYCQQEWRHALALNKRVLCVLVAPVDLAQLPEPIRALQFIDASGSADPWDGEAGQKLLAALGNCRDYHHRHKVLLAAALKWERNDFNPSLLPRGHQLEFFEAWLKVAQRHPTHPALEIQERYVREGSIRPGGLSQEVFISYSRTDSDFARKLNDALQTQGKTTWFDQESIPPGANFQHEIEQGIANADNFLFILSPAAVQSPYCAQETEFAARLGKRFVTLLHRPVDPAALPPDLAQVQWLDFADPESFEADFRELVRALDIDREHVQAHTKWLQQAAEWKERGRSTDLLLRGDEYVLAAKWLEATDEEAKQPAATSLQRAYLAASERAIAAANQAKKRAEIRLRGLLTASVVGLIIACVSAVFAWRYYAQASKQADSLLVQRLSQEAKNRRQDAPQLSLHLAVAAYQLEQRLASDERSAETVLREVAQQPLGRMWIPPSEVTRIDQVAISDDGQWLATAERFRPPAPKSFWGRDEAPPPERPRVRAWTPEHPRARTWPLAATKLAFGPEHRLAIADEGGDLWLWWPGEPTPLRVAEALGAITALAFDASGLQLAIGTLGDGVRVLSLKRVEPPPPAPAKRPFPAVRALSFAPDGRWLAALGADRTVGLWPAARPAPIWLNRAGVAATTPLDLSWQPEEGARRPLWRDYPRAAFAPPLLFQHREIVALARHPRMPWLATVDKNGQLDLWNIGHRNPFSAPDGWRASREDGPLAATESLPVTWNDEQLQPTFPAPTGLHRFAEPPRQLTFSADGQHLLALSGDTQLQVWQPSVWLNLRRALEGHRAAVTRLALDGTDQNLQLLSADAEGGVRWWPLAHLHPARHARTMDLSSPALVGFDPGHQPVILRQQTLWRNDPADIASRDAHIHLEQCRQANHESDTEHHCRQAIERFRQAKRPLEEGDAQLLLASWFFRQGDHEGAARLARQALVTFHPTRDDSRIANALRHLAMVERQRQHWDDAIRYAQASIQTYQRGGDPAGVQLATELLGQSHLAAGQFARAADELATVLASADRAREPYRAAYLLNQIGNARLKNHELDAAEQALRASLELAKPLQANDVLDSAYRLLETLHGQRGQPEQAAMYRALRQALANTLHCLPAASESLDANPTERLLPLFPAHHPTQTLPLGPMDAMRFNSRNRLLLVAGAELAQWEMGSNQVINRHRFQYPIAALAPVAADQWRVALAPGNVARLRIPSTGDMSGETELPFQRENWHSDWRGWFATHGSANPSTSRAELELQLGGGETGGGRVMQALSKTLQVEWAGSPPRLRAWRLTADHKRPLPAPEIDAESLAGITQLALDPAGEWLAAGHHDGWVMLWSIARGGPPVYLPDALRHPVSALAFSPDGQWLAGAGRQVKLWPIPPNLIIEHVCQAAGKPLDHETRKSYLGDDRSIPGCDPRVLEEP